MLVLKNKLFEEWATQLKISDSVLRDVIDEIAHGLFEANLGGNIYKKRLSIKNRGKRGGARTIIAFKAHEKAIFIYGFDKSYDENQIQQAIKTGKLIEVKL